jgi:hypothetical protein
MAACAARANQRRALLGKGQWYAVGLLGPSGAVAQRQLPCKPISSKEREGEQLTQLFHDHFKQLYGRLPSGKMELLQHVDSSVWLSGP